MNPSLIAYLYGAAVVAVGVYGFISKGSVISLIASGIMGALIAGSGLLAARASTGGVIPLLVMLVMATLYFGSSFARNQSALHFGVLAVLGAISLVAVLILSGAIGVGRR